LEAKNSFEIGEQHMMQQLYLTFNFVSQGHLSSLGTVLGLAD
jgi:hypothetical protein